LNYLIIDGSYGEGGGQIVRTAVSLSTITGKPIQITNIRSKRNKPGLRTQHFSAVKAVADLFHAKVENLKVGADWIRFTPSHHTHPFGSTDYFDYGITKIDIGTAGSFYAIPSCYSLMCSNYSYFLRKLANVTSWS
jgi:RNA 3'-terminal phosphate cyclase (ATP)